jgi:chromosome transmission fidelity protein 1
MKDFRQLFPTKSEQQIATLSCDHVIPRENLLTQVITLGPSKKPMEFKFDSRNDDGLASTSAGSNGSVF